MQGDRLGGLADAEQQAEQGSGQPRPLRQPPQAAGADRDEDERGDAVPLGEQVGHGHAGDEVLHQRKGRAPGRADEQQENGSQEGTGSGHRCHTRKDSITLGDKDVTG
ncbi:hypothetical protein GCM10027187_41580 [Streptosporangium sandarakinum]